MRAQFTETGTLRRVATLVIVGAMLVAAVQSLRAVDQAPARATEAPPAALAFEAASVRPNPTPVLDPEDSSISPDPRGTLRVVNFPLRLLILFAYQIQNFQLAAPDWIASAKFDIQARAGRELPPPRAGSPSPMQMMLRTLLADRFKLVVHTETRQLPIYELVLARPDGARGPQLRPATEDCAARLAALQAGTPVGPMAPPGPGGCGVSIRLGRIRFGGSPLATFADTLSRLAQRVVVDRTGLAGNWDFELTFTPDPAALQLPPGMPLPPVAPDVDANAPSLFTALEEQLGLKLRPATGPVEVLVIDRVEPPVEN
jgi:uncharacterized protein (TIGR03435 family)